MPKFFLWSFFFIFSLQSFGQGSIVGNGGDGIAIEFRSLARDILQNLKATSILSSADLEKFSKSVNDSEITTQDRLFLNDKEVDAINYPTLQKITISRSRWLLTSRTIPAAVSLVFHEILGLLNIHDDKLVKKYTDSYVENFVNAKGDSRPELILQCKISMASTQVNNFVPDARALGAKNFLIYRQNSDYLIHYQDNLLPMSLRPYDTINHFLGYFKCHMNPDRTSIVCSEPPCSQITLKFDQDKQVSVVRVKIDRVTDNCAIPANQLGDTILNYLYGDMVFPAAKCLAISGKHP